MYERGVKAVCRINNTGGYNMNGECSNSFWIGKMARLEIVKDEHRLSFTKTLILELDETTITFKDKFGEVLAFNRSLVKEMKLI
jgi:hypothetical protein